MQFFKSAVVAAAALASFVAAQGRLAFTDTPPSVTAGNTYQIKYDAPTDAPVTIALRNGVSGNLNTVATLTSSGSGGSSQTYTWNVESSLISGQYALSIAQQGSDPNYTKMFTLSGSSKQSTSSSSGTMMSSMMPSSSMSHPYGMTVATPSMGMSMGMGMSMSTPSMGMSTPTVVSKMMASVPGVAQPTGYSSPMASMPSNSSYSAPSMPSATSGGMGKSGGSGSNAAASPSPSGNSASTLGSSMALVLGAVAAFAFLN